MQKHDNCPEGGEGIVITISKDKLPTDVTRCTCTVCPTQNCARLNTYLKEQNNLNKDSLYVSFCGNLTLNPETDCNYFLKDSNV